MRFLDEIALYDYGIGVFFRVATPRVVFLLSVLLLGCTRRDGESARDAGRLESAASLGSVTQLALRARVERVTVYGAEFAAETDSGLRVVLELSGEQVPHRVRELFAEPAHSQLRIWVEATPSASLGLGRRTLHVGGLEAVTLQHEEGGFALLLELSQGARADVVALAGPQRLVIDVLPPPKADAMRAPTVVIDPGHGGQDRGSPGLLGLWEGPLTLDIAQRVRTRLREMVPTARVHLTREDDTTVSLDERAAMANALSASLFVSIHLNAAEHVVERGGVTSFVLDHQDEEGVLRLAARENGTAVNEVSPLQYLVGSLARERQRASSERLAQAIQRFAVRRGRRHLPRLRDRGVRSAMFYVLVGASMPAGLVEGAFLTQPDEAIALAEAPYRDALARGIAEGIAHFLAEN